MAAVILPFPSRARQPKASRKRKRKEYKFGTKKETREILFCCLEENIQFLGRHPSAPRRIKELLAEIKDLEGWDWTYEPHAS